MTPAGFPHSDICGSSPVCRSPQLFAAYHVLLRRLVPRHSPYALSCLIFSRIQSVEICIRSFSLASSFPKDFPELETVVSLVSYQKSLLCLASMQFSMYASLLLSRAMTEAFHDARLPSFIKSASGGLKWTRTTDLALIRRAL